MHSSKIKKIVFFNDQKVFASEEGFVTHLFEEAMLYDEDMTDGTIKSFFDNDCQDKLEIWKVRVSIETI